ncbi:hypothetical protein ACLMJK_006077 [Lecanora helva]
MEKLATVTVPVPPITYPNWRPSALDVAFGLLVISIAWTYFQHGLSRVPGPFLASITPIWKILTVWKEDAPRRSLALHKQYGPVVRVGPKHVSVSSPEALQLVYSFKTAFAKAPMYAVGQPHVEGQPLPNLFSVRDPKTHIQLKRTIGGIYSMSSMKELEFRIDNCVNIFLRKFREATQNGTAVMDMSAWVQFFSFDTIGEVNFSKNFGFLETGTDVDWAIKEAEDRMRYFELAGQCPSIEGAFSKLRKLAGKSQLNPLIEYALEAVRERVESKESPEDVMTRLLRLHETKPDKLSRLEVTAAVYINLVAGHDVLAITFRTILYHLGRNLRARQNLLDEIFSASQTFSKPVKMSEASQLPYLSAVIHEALRIHPNIGLMLERVVPSGGTTLHGYTLAEGTVIGLNAAVIHRNEDIFGEDVESFRPERWIECPPEQLREMHRNLFTFGAGPRGCVGKNLALLQIHKLIVELYRNFDMELVNPDQDWHVQGGWIHKQTNMDMYISQNGRGW